MDGWKPASALNCTLQLTNHKSKNPPDFPRGFANWFGETSRRAHDVARLKAFRPFEQIEFHGLALIQRTITVLLDSREMHEHILAGRALDESVSLRPVEPLHSTLLSHKYSFRIVADLVLCRLSVC